MDQVDRAPEDIPGQYQASIRERTLRFSKLAGFLAIILPPVFLLQDMHVIWYPVNTVPWRIPPIIMGVFLLIFSLTPLKRYTRVLSGIYYLFLLSLMTMMCGLAVLYMRYAIFSSIIIGMIIVIFVIFFGSMGGFRYLIPIYAVPFFGSVAYMAVMENPGKNHFIVLSNPFVLIILTCVFAEIQERLRFSRFKALRSIEVANRELLEKNRVIVQNNSRMQEQMKLARIIQHSLIPQAVPRVRDLEIHAVYMPLLEIGGDLYDFIHFKEPNLFGIFIADVTGHGVPAALVTSMVKTLSNMSGKDKLAPSDFLRFLNEKIIDMGSLEFISAFYAIYDSKTRTLRYARAGHCLPYLIRKGEVAELGARGALLGVDRYQLFQEKEIPLMTGDKVFFFTDGLIEAENSAGIQFADTLVRDLREHGELPIRDLVTLVYDHLLAFIGGKSFEDDVCIVGIEVR
jgi:serine phosphatase RsbU (regulator of sigma subunit)